MWMEFSEGSREVEDKPESQWGHGVCVMWVSREVFTLREVENDILVLSTVVT